MRRAHLLQGWTRRARADDAPVPGVEAVARTHVGKVRQINEDRFLVRTDRRLWAVADGMGGHSAGTEAANAAIDELRSLADGVDELSAEAIGAALARANRRIYRGASDHGAISGTTVVVAWLNRDRLTILWAGDSRVYRLSQGQACCLTRDHSLVQELLDAGQITETEARGHPHGNIVTRALGVAAEVQMDQVIIPVRNGDRLLLCSDGVSRSLDADECAEGNASLGQFADDVLGSALQRDGSDNATLVAIQLNVVLPAPGERP